MFESIRQGLLEDGLAKGSLRPRPSIPFLLILAGVLWAALVLYEAIMWQLPMGDIGTPFTAVVAVLLAAMAICAWRMVRGGTDGRIPRTMLYASLLAFCTGLLFAHMFWQDIRSGRMRIAEGVSGKQTYLIRGDACRGDYGFRSDALLELDGRRISILVYWRDEDDVQPAGAVVEAYGTVKAYGLEEDSRSSLRKGRCGSVTLHSPQFISWAHSASALVGPFRQRIITDLSAHPGDGGALLQGVLLGERSRIDGTETEGDFQSTGLAHLIAVSGSHLAVVSSLMIWLLTALGFSRKPTFALLSISLVFYLVLSGLQVSALRACLMTEVGMFALFDARRKDTRAALGLSICLILTADPSAAFSFSFGLSVLAVCGICFLAPLLQNWLESPLPVALKPLAQPVALTVAAQFACLPLTIPTFSVLSPISPLANVMVAPLLDLMLGMGLCATLVSMVLPGLAHLLYALASCIGVCICGLAGVLADLPFASLNVEGSLVLCIALTVMGSSLLWASWPEPTVRGLLGSCLVIVLLACIGILPYALPSSPRMVVLDVGQGDAILLSAGYHHILIDAGGDPVVLARALARNHVRDLDAVIVTHLHDDHYGGLEGSGARLHVGETFVALPILERYPESKGLNIMRAVSDSPRPTGLETGDHLLCGPFDLKVVSPDRICDKGGNQDSLCLRLSYDGDADGREDASALLCGDAESQTTAPLASRGLLGTIDVLKVGHHGSAVSLDDSLLGSLDVRFAIISVGEDNPYGHPDPLTLERLRAAGVPVRRTDLNGDVSVHFSPAGIRVNCTGETAA